MHESRWYLEYFSKILFLFVYLIGPYKVGPNWPFFHSVALKRADLKRAAISVSKSKNGLIFYEKSAKICAKMGKTHENQRIFRIFGAFIKAGPKWP